MKPIEIHIEGYKIVISEEDDDIHTKAMEEKIVYIPKPKIIPTPNTPDPCEYPYVTWTNDDTFNINNTAQKTTIVRDTMVGKKVDENEL